MGPSGLNGRDGEQGEIGPEGKQGLEGQPGKDGQQPEEFIDIVDKILPFRSSIFLVLCCDSVSGLCSQGSGVKGQEGYVYTATHVVAGADTCEIYSQNPVVLQEVSSLFYTTSPAPTDFAAIAVSVPGPVVEVVRNYFPVIGEPVVVVGTPAWGDLPLLEGQFTFGYVTASEINTTLSQMAIGNWPNAWTTDAVAWHGNSGGPVFNHEGRLIGILVGGTNGAGLNNGPDLSIVLPIPTVGLP